MGAPNAEVNFKRLVHQVRMVEEVECDIDEDVDNEHFQERNINNSFINKLKDFSSFNPSGNKGREKETGSMVMIPRSMSRAAAAGEVSPTELKTATLVSLRKIPETGKTGPALESPDSVVKLAKFDETPNVLRSDEDKSPIKRPLTLPTQGEMMEVVFSHAQRQQKTPRVKEFEVHFRQQLVPFADNIGENSTPRSITSTPATKQQNMTDQPMGTIEADQEMPEVVEKEAEETPCATEQIMAETSVKETVNQFLDTPSGERNSVQKRIASSELLFKRDPSTASSHPNLPSKVLQTTKFSIPDIGTDPRIQIQFFSQLLYEKDRELMQQRHRFQKLRANCKLQAARHKKISILLRDAKLDNADLQLKTNQLIVCKLMQPT